MTTKRAAVDGPPGHQPLFERKVVSAMLDPITDNDDGMFHKRNGIDRSVGYLIAGVVVLLFFLLTVLGMGRLQQISGEAGTMPRPPAEEKAADIGGFKEAELKD